MREKVDLTAVWDEDLHDLLESLGILEDLTSRKTYCAICGRKVDVDNLGTIIPTTKAVQLTCDDVNCVQAVTSREAPVSNG